MSRMPAYVAMEENRTQPEHIRNSPKSDCFCAVSYCTLGFQSFFFVEKNTVRKNCFFFLQLCKSPQLHFPAGKHFLPHTTLRLFNEYPSPCQNGHSDPKFGLPLKQQPSEFTTIRPHFQWGYVKRKLQSWDHIFLTDLRN